MTMHEKRTPDKAATRTHFNTRFGQTNMATYLKIENPGVCPVEGFILLGATSKRLVDNESLFTVGQFGSGGKLSVNVLLRAKL
jgi:hypothetical protein